MKPLLLICSFLLAGSTPLLADEWLTNVLTTFEATKKAAWEEADKEIEVLEAEFVKALDGLIGKAQGDGNLDRILAAQNAKAKIKGIAPVAGAEPDTLIERGQKNFDDRRAEKLKQANTKLEGLLKNHLKALKARVVLYTQTGKLDEALNVRNAQEAATTERRLPITCIDRRIVEKMDQDKDEVIVEADFVDFWAKKFQHKDKNGDSLLDAAEFPFPTSLEPSDADRDGRLNIDEYKNVYRSQFHDHDRNKDGRLTAADGE